MAFVAAHTSAVSYDNAAGSLTDVSGKITSIGGVDLTRATLDTTGLGDAAVTMILGLKQGQTISISGNWDTTIHTQMIAVEALTTGATQTLRYSPAGTGTGDPFVSFETLLTQYGPSTDVTDKVTWSATLQVTGAATPGTH